MAYLYTWDLFRQGLTYDEYGNTISDILLKPPAGEAEEKMQYHIRINADMMRHFDRAYVLSREIRSVMAAADPMYWIVLTEPWCGDAAYLLPLLAAIEKSYPEKVFLRMFARDSYPELMDAHLTNGARSIPKLVCLDEMLSEKGTWGPRPARLHELVNDWKQAGVPIREIISKVNEWYLKDETRSMQSELSGLIASFQQS